MQSLWELFEEAENRQDDYDEEAVEYAAMRAGEEQDTCADFDNSFDIWE